MATLIQDVVLVHDTPANLATDLKAGMKGFDTTNNRWALKRFADSQMLYWTDDSGQVLKAGNVTIADVKTFTSFPVSPSAAPTTDYQFANKKYVDDSIEVEDLWDRTTSPDYTVMKNTGDNLGVGTISPTVKIQAEGIDPIIWIKDTSSPPSAITRTIGGLQLSGVGMNASSNKYTSALKFVSTDSAFVTENPKLLSYIIGRATETYSDDTKGGMAIDFGITPNTPGTTNVPVVGMILSEAGLAITNNLSVGGNINIDDNDATALQIIEGSNVYLKIDTTTGAKVITLTNDDTDTLVIPADEIILDPVATITAATSLNISAKLLIANNLSLNSDSISGFDDTAAISIYGGPGIGAQIDLHGATDLSDESKILFKQAGVFRFEMNETGEIINWIEDNQNEAFRVGNVATGDYIICDSRIGTEKITFGNATIDQDFEFSGDGLVIIEGSLKVDTTISINDASPEGSGLTVNQGSNDDIILSLKSSDINHGVTDLCETDTFGFVKKNSDSSGGLEIVGLTDTNGVGNGVEITGVLAGALASGVLLNGALKDGTGITSIAAGSDLCKWANNGVERMTLRGNGDLKHPTSNKHLFRDSALGMYSQADTFLDIFADGAVRIGDSSSGAPTNYTNFGSDGFKTTVGDARARKEYRVDASGVASGAAAPTDGLRDIGASGGVKKAVKKFSKTTQNDIYVEFHSQCEQDFTEDVEFHLMWIPGASWTSGNYVWKLEFLVKDENGDTSTGAPTTISEDVTPSNAVDMIETEFSTTIAMAAEQILIGHFYRDVASDNADDVGEFNFLEMSYVVNKDGEAL